ncbi:MAG: hypothetical protein PHH14_05390 [Candidatus Margulisbacteria bacterium]|nr:hypothetical protein [Candidatus Margulisiibacteriota bacterium]
MAGYVEGACKLAAMIDDGLSEPFDNLCNVGKDAASDVCTVLEGTPTDEIKAKAGVECEGGEGTGIYTMIGGEAVKLDSVEGGMKMGFHNDKVAKEGDVLTGVISNKKAIDQKVARTQG